MSTTAVISTTTKATEKEKIYFTLYLIVHCKRNSEQEPRDRNWRRDCGETLLTDLFCVVFQPASLYNSGMEPPTNDWAFTHQPIIMKMPQRLALVPALFQLSFLLHRWLWLVSNWNKHQLHVEWNMMVEQDITCLLRKLTKVKVFYYI